MLNSLERTDKLDIDKVVQHDQNTEQLVVSKQDTDSSRSSNIHISMIQHLIIFLTQLKPRL